MAVSDARLYRCFGAAEGARKQVETQLRRTTVANLSSFCLRLLPCRVCCPTEAAVATAAPGAAHGALPPHLRAGLALPRHAGAGSALCTHRIAQARV